MRKKKTKILISQLLQTLLQNDGREDGFQDYTIFSPQSYSWVKQLTRDFRNSRKQKFKPIKVSDWVPSLCSILILLLCVVSLRSHSVLAFDSAWMPRKDPYKNGEGAKRNSQCSNLLLLAPTKCDLFIKLIFTSLGCLQVSLEISWLLFWWHVVDWWKTGGPCQKVNRCEKFL